MSNQPPHDGSHDPIHDQPTQSVPQVPSDQDSADQGPDNRPDWSAPSYEPPAWQASGERSTAYGSGGDPFAAPTGSESSSQPPQYGQSGSGQQDQQNQQPPYDQRSNGSNGSNGGYGQQGQYGQGGGYGGQSDSGGYSGHGGYGAAPQYGKGSYDQSQQGTYGYPQQQGYTQPGYYAQQPQQRGGTNVSAIVLTVLAGMTALSFYFSLAGIPAVIIAIIALTKQNNDMAGSRRLTRIGWIVWAVLMVICVIVIIIFFAWLVSTNSFDNRFSDSYDPSYSGGSSF
ncbi:MAG: hypothetical protein M3Y49_06520 [Actinomycetota bacterium]|nr:hypothetical protein [Actinomycetota bacterium]